MNEGNHIEERKRYIRLLGQSVSTLRNKLSGKVERLSIFGSYARGRRDLFTDLDVLILMQSEKPFLERTKELYAMLHLPVDADILCYTPEEFERLKAKPFFKKIVSEEVVLYEK